jgi:DNA polymerase III epsilon subunit-like protein
MQKNYKIISSKQEYSEALEHVKNSDVVAYDTETTGLNVRKDKIIGFSFSGSEVIYKT